MAKTSVSFSHQFGDDHPVPAHPVSKGKTASSRRAAGREPPTVATLLSAADGPPLPTGEVRLLEQLRSLRRRLRDVVKQELCCIVNVSHGFLEQWHSGKLESVVAAAGRLNISGENFSFYLRETSVGSITVADGPELGDIGPVIELYSRANRMLMRIHSAPGPQSNAHWREIMAEPLQAEVGATSEEKD